MTDKLSTGFVTLERSIIQWRWFTVPNTAHLFVYLILRANHEDRDFMDVTVHRGELVASLSHLSHDTGLTVNQVRTALNHLKTTGEITCTSTTRYTLISIVNYDLYQSVTTNKSTNKSQSKHKRTTNRSQQTTTKNNENHDNHENHVCVTTPTLSEVESYFSEMGRSSADASKFYHYNQARGWKIGKNRIENWQSAANIWIGEQPDVEPSSNDDDQLDDFGRPIKRGYA